MPTDIVIARAAKTAPIATVAAALDIPSDALAPYGHDKAKLTSAFLRSLDNKPFGKLILVAGINPTKAGEGKTTTTVGLGDALTRRGKRAAICLREPSLGPCFGVKGGAAGGGYAQVVPMEDINLHFTGDFHAITSAHNLLAAAIDNHIHWGNALDIDSRRIVWRRVLDMNDRALREITIGQGGVSNGFVRTDGFDITVASEIMAVLCLSRDIDDLKSRISRIVVAYTRGKQPVTAGDLKMHGAMATLLKDAVKPNLVQTLEGTPAFVHGGPFANIAHGCNSLIATQTALRLADYTVTEAGFGADLGAEKFIDIKCRAGGLHVDCTVIVATVRALKLHGGVSAKQLGEANVAAVQQGFANLARHIDNMRRFGVPVVVAINRFVTDSNDELAAIVDGCATLDTTAVICDHWARGGEGALDLADAVLTACEQPNDMHFLYDDELSLWQKIERIATTIYGAAEVTADVAVRKQLQYFAEMGCGHFPVCIAKTPMSFATDPSLLGAPSGHTLPVREVRLARGAGFVVVICGDVMTMPGLPREPAAERIDIDASGVIDGLF